MPDLSKVTALLPDLADYLVYSAIAVVTLIGLFKCLLPLWKTSAALRRAISRLQAEQRINPSGSRPVSSESACAAHGSGSCRTRSSWTAAGFLPMWRIILTMIP